MFIQVNRSESSGAEKIFQCCLCSLVLDVDGELFSDYQLLLCSKRHLSQSRIGLLLMTSRNEVSCPETLVLFLPLLVLISLLDLVMVLWVL